MHSKISSLIDEHLVEVKKLHALIPDIAQASEMIQTALKSNGTIFWMGNGGSAADCQHMAAEFVGRFVKERQSFASVALTTDSSILTAVGNDYGFDQIFARQISGLCKQNDVVVGISTSGNSTNIIRGIEAAKVKGASTIGLIGKDGGKLKQIVDVAITIPSDVTARIQECHILIGHIICELIEAHV